MLITNGGRVGLSRGPSPFIPYSQRSTLGEIRGNHDDRSGRTPPLDPPSSRISFTVGQAGPGRRGLLAWRSAAVLWLGASAALAGDWPQILGPERNGQADGERLAATWPDGGPPVVWQAHVGRGFAGVAVKNGRLVLFHRQGNQLVAEARSRHGAPTVEGGFSDHLREHDFFGRRTSLRAAR